MSLSASQIEAAFAALGQAPPSTALLASLEGIGDTYAAIDAIIALPQVQSTDIPIIAMFDLALGHPPTSATLASIVENNPSVFAIATQFVESQSFANIYNGGTILNPNTVITSANDSIITALFINGLGHPPTTATLDLFHGLTLAQAFFDFATSNTVAIGSLINGQITQLIETAPGVGVPGQAATPVSLALTAGDDTNLSLTTTAGSPSSDPLGSNVTVTGTIDSSFIFGDPLIWSFQPGDNLSLDGATLQITDVNHTAGNELAGITLTGPFVFDVTELAHTFGDFDFSLASGVTEAESLNSTNTVLFANMPTGSVVAASGAATTADELFYTYFNPNAAPTLTVDGGINVPGGFFFFQDSSTAKPTSATINSTGAANGSTFGPTEPENLIFFGLTGGEDGKSVTSLTVNAATNLDGILFTGDYNPVTGASLTVNGSASSVELFFDGAPIPFNSIDASGLTAGGLIIAADSLLKTFVGGGGGGNALAYEGEFLPASATSIDGGGGTGNVLSAELVDGVNPTIFSNWQILDVTNLQNVVHQTLDASILTNDAITGLGFSASDTGTDTVLNIAANSTLGILGSDYTETYGFSGVAAGDQIQVDAGLIQTHLGGSGTTAVTFANEDTTGTKSLELASFESTGDTTISIQSNGGGFDNAISQIFETNNTLTDVTIAGANYASVGLFLHDGDVTNGVETDTTHTQVGPPTPVASSLTTIDASATTGGVFIAAGDDSFDAKPGQHITYTGLAIDGGSGTDTIFNGAQTGSIADGSGNSDFDGLGGSGGSVSFGAGAHDLAYIGTDPIAGGDAVHIVAGVLQPELFNNEGEGAAVGNTVTFGAAGTGTVQLWEGAESGTTSETTLVNTAAWTNVVGAAPGLSLDFTHTGIGTSLVDFYTLTPADTNLITAFTHAVDSVGTTSAFVVFSFGGDEFVVGHHGGFGLHADDAVVELVGISNQVIGATTGIAHLA